MSVWKARLSGISEIKDYWTENRGQSGDLGIYVGGAVAEQAWSGAI